MTQIRALLAQADGLVRNARAGLSVEGRAADELSEMLETAGAVRKSVEAITAALAAEEVRIAPPPGDGTSGVTFVPPPW